MNSHQKTILSNGIRVITEEIPNLLSVAIGVWVCSGSRHEKEEEKGVSHFLEHLFFKGTRRRSALDIAKEIDSLGGILNAFTSKEYTCFYAKVLHNHLPRAIDLLSDIFQGSLFDSQEIEKEREVILQEIRLFEDTPDEYIHEVFYKSIFKGHPLGWPILGTYETVKGVSRESILSFIDRSYSSGKVIISAAGKLKHQDVVKMIEDSFTLKLRDVRSESQVGFSEASPLSVIQKDLEQVHFCFGGRALPYAHPKRFAFHILNTILGGGVSSRLFQEIREKRGWAYSVYSYLATYSDTGAFGIYVGSSPERVRDIIFLLMEQMEDLANNPTSSEELLRSKEQLKGNLFLSIESSEAQMTKLAKGEIYFGRYMPVEEILHGIETVTREEVMDMAKTIFDPRGLSLAVLGPMKEEDPCLQGIIGRV